VILVEGGDDERMVQRLLPPGSAARVYTFPLNGNDPTKVRDTAAAVAKAPGWANVRRVAVVLDAEEDVATARALADVAFAAMGLPSPAPGRVERRDDVRVGAFFVPDNQSPGASESLLLRVAEPSALGCVDAFFQCTPNLGATVAQRDKARAQALVAAINPGARADTLWDRVDPEHVALLPLRRFLADLLL
jgi:hypothetical protein